MKALRYLTDKDSRNLDSPVLPLLSATFVFNDLDEKTNHRWKHAKQEQTNLASRMYKPIFEDGRVQIIPIFTRNRGTSEVVLISHTSPECHDYHFKTMQWFDHNVLYKFPIDINTRLLLPIDMIGYDYHAEYTGCNYQIDWAGTDLDQQLIRSMDQLHYVFPIQSRPMIKLTSISDGTTFYGGAEEADYRLNMTFEWEIEIPGYIVLKTDYEIDEIKRYIIINGEYETDFVVNDHLLRIGDSIVEDGRIAYEHREHHDVIIPDDHSDGVPFDLTLPAPVQPDDRIYIASYWGFLKESFQYDLKDPNTITLRVQFRKDDYITIYYYEKV